METQWHIYMILTFIRSLTTSSAISPFFPRANFALPLPEAHTVQYVIKIGNLTMRPL